MALQSSKVNNDGKGLFSVVLPSCLQTINNITFDIHRTRSNIDFERDKLMKLQNEYMGKIFDQCADAPEGQLNDTVSLKVDHSAEVKFRLHAVLHSQSSGEDQPSMVSVCHRIVSIPLNKSAVSCVNDVLRTITTQDDLWKRHAGDTSLAELRQGLIEVNGRPDFASDWVVETVSKNSKQQDASVVAASVMSTSVSAQKLQMHREWKMSPSATKTGLSSINMAFSNMGLPFDNNQMSGNLDMTQIHLRRSVLECAQALDHYKLNPREIIVTARSVTANKGWVLHVNITPTAQSHKEVLQISRVASNLASQQLGDPKRITGRMLAVSVVGIQNDHVDDTVPLSCVKRFALQEVAWTPHNRFGVHDVHYAHFAMPQIRKYAQWLGEIHMMTQVAKALLKSRDSLQSAPELNEVVAEQRGAQLKSEARLCAYWNKINGMLNAEEQECLQGFIATLRKRPEMLSMEFKQGVLAQTADVLGDDFKYPKTRSLNRSSVTLNIKAAFGLPIEKLNRSDKFLKVRINNDWDLEMSTLAYD